MVDTNNTDKKTSTDPPSSTGSFDPVPADLYQDTSTTNTTNTADTADTEDPSSGTTEPE